MKVHPAAKLFPELDDEAIHELAQDIAENGQQAPILVDADGVLLDGRNRLRACKIARVEPAFKTWHGKGSPVALIVSLNLKRRHLTKSQKAALAVELLPILEEEAAKRKQAGKALDLTQKIEQGRNRNDLTAAAHAGTLAGGVNRQYVSQAKQIATQSPAVFEQVKAGKISLQDARREVVKEQRQSAARENPWPKAENEMREAVEAGETVVVNVGKHFHLIAWAERMGLFVMVDRSTAWGNPFLLSEDGSRDEVCDAYAKHYLPHKPSLLKRVKSLKGKVLGCHCAPARCHADAIKKAADRA